MKLKHLSLLFDPETHENLTLEDACVRRRGDRQRHPAIAQQRLSHHSGHTALREGRGLFRQLRLPVEPLGAGAVRGSE